MDYLKEIDAWLAKTKTAVSRLGMLAAANPKAVERIRDGTARVETLNRVLAYIRANPKGHQ